MFSEHSGEWPGPCVDASHRGTTTSTAMRVELEHYPRRRLYECFRHHPLPVLAISTAIDISDYEAAVKNRGMRFYTTLCWLISKAINDSACFRHRIVNNVLVEFPLIHPSVVVGLDDGNISFADATYTGNVHADLANLRAAMGAARSRPNQDFTAGRDDRIFLTHLPWLSFTGIQHPYTPLYASIPVISTGRSFRNEGKDMLPIAVQAHHALVDGRHVADLLAHLTDLCRQLDNLVCAT